MSGCGDVVAAFVWCEQVDEPPVLWTVIIGNPSANKSPALDAVLVPLKQAERRLREKWPRRVISIMAADRDGAFALARQHGFDPDDEESDDLVILHTIEEGEPFIIPDRGV